MKTVRDIIAAFEGPTQFGRACGFDRNPGARGSDMLQRGSIPVKYWPALIARAASQDIPGITYEALVEAHAAPDGDPGTSTAPAGAAA